MKEFLDKLDDYILVVNNKGLIKYCNEALLNKLNYTIEEIEEISIYNLFANDVSIKGFIEEETLYEVISKQKQKIKVLVRGYWQNINSENLVFLVFKERFDSEDILKKALDRISFKIWIKDLNGRYRYVNKIFAQSLGVKKEDMIGKLTSDFFKGDNLKNIMDNDKLVITTKKQNLKEECIVDNGVKRWNRTHFIPILNKVGEVEYISGFSKDITLTKNLESQIVYRHNKLSTVKNDIYNNDILESKRLLNIDSELISFLNADSISIWLYDDDNEKLIPFLKVGLSDETLANIDEVHVNREKFYSDMHTGEFGKIQEINNIQSFIDKRVRTEKYLKYYGVYKVEFDNEILGLLCLGYRELNLNKQINNDYINFLCNQIATLIKKEKLSLQLKHEFENRKKLERELQNFLEIAADLMAIIDKDSRFIKVNGRWNKILGWEEEELLKMNYASVIHEDDLEDVIIKANSLKYKVGYKDKNFEHRFKCKDGKIKWISWNGKYNPDKNQYMVTGKDITQQKIAENRNEFFEKALQLESIKNEFFANISHEFKTPLNIILATIQLINTYISNEKITVADDVDLDKYIKSIKQNSYRLLRLANNLIDMTKIDSGYYKINLENHNIVNIIEDITLSVASYIENKGIKLTFDTDIEEKIIACDPDKIERIMLNLLSNATKYTNKNGKIDVDLTSDEEFIVVSIKDSGIGIPKEKVGAIFNRFVQVDSSLTRKCEGSGIGLSLVKSLIEMHGGEINVYSEQGIGTEFILKLPVKTIDNSAEEKIITTNAINKVEKCNIEFSDIYDIH